MNCDERADFDELPIGTRRIVSHVLLGGLVRADLDLTSFTKEGNV